MVRASRYLGSCNIMKTPILAQERRLLCSVYGACGWYIQHLIYETKNAMMSYDIVTRTLVSICHRITGRDAAL